MFNKNFFPQGTKNLLISPSKKEELENVPKACRLRFVIVILKFHFNASS